MADNSRDSSDGPDVVTDVLMAAAGQESLHLPGVTLTVLEGPDAGKNFNAQGGSFRVGSAEGADFVLSDPSVSREHFEVALSQDEVILKDLGSTNGTRVDGVRVIDAYLSPASRIEVGGTVIRVVPNQMPVVVPISANQKFGSMIGASVPMRELFAILELVSPTEATVLIEGESGTGKELVAEGIHEHSTRAEGPFVAVDCGAVPENLIESELFGHVRGAFTGAIGDRAGVFEQAHRGTLFLDEIGELPLNLQPKLLRVLEKREIRPVGSERVRPIDVRVVAATNRSLMEEVNRGAFREDLYYRLAVIRTKVTPLRNRKEDIALLVTHFMEMIAPGSGAPDPKLISSLINRAWPGNVRELKNAVQEYVVMGSPALLSNVGPHTPANEPLPGMEALHALPYKAAQESVLSRFERDYLTAALHASGGSVSEAARQAGLSRRYVQRLMKRHGLRADSDSESGS